MGTDEKDEETPKEGVSAPTTQLLPRLELEETPAWESAIRGMLSLFIRPFSLFRTTRDYPYLQDVRKRNRFTFLAPTLATVIATAIITAMILFFTKDDLDPTSLSHLRITDISTNPAAFAFYLRDLPMIVLLVIYSMVFYGATTKYLKVFEPALVNACSDFLRNARALVHLPQILAIGLIAFGGGQIATGICILVALLFAYAALFPRTLARDLRNQLKSVYNERGLDGFPRRKARLLYIHDYEVLGFVYRGWAALNTLFAIFVFLYVWFPKAAGALSLLDAARPFVLNSSYAIIFCAVIFSFVGAMRSYSKEMDRRYFNAVEIFNREFMHKTNGTNQDADIEDDLGGVTFYALETDPTVEVEASTAERTSMGSPVLAVLETTRALSSLCFAAVILVASQSTSLAIAVLLAMLFSFSFNDLTDYLSGKDQYCHPNRPLPSARLSVRGAILICAILSLGMVATLLASSVTVTAPLALFLGGILYSINFKRLFPILATPFWCALLAFVLATALEFGVWGFLGLWASILARELVLDLRDADSDFAFNQRRNLAYILRPYHWQASFVLVALASVCFALAGNLELALTVVVLGILLTLWGWGQFQRSESSIAAKRFGVFSHLIWPVVLLYG